MTTIDTEIAARPAGDDLEPLAVSPRQACRLLSIGNTRLYQLLSDGELASYREGRGRRITMHSIRRRLARLLADTGANGTSTPKRAGPRRNRPRGETIAPT
jgi:excisionase family DNA binding protein